MSAVFLKFTSVFEFWWRTLEIEPGNLEYRNDQRFIKFGSIGNEALGHARDRRGILGQAFPRNEA
jgi:hypothetical protein